MSDNRPELIRVSFDVEHARVRSVENALSWLFNELSNKANVSDELCTELLAGIKERAPHHFQPREVPVSIGLIEDISERYLYVAFDDFQKALRYDQLDPAAKNTNFVLGVVLKHIYEPDIGVVKPDFKQNEQVRGEILEFLQPTEILELWARHPFRDVCILQDIFGGEQELVLALRSKGIGRVVFRDTDLLRVQLCNPELQVVRHGPRHAALYDAWDDLERFNAMVRIAVERERSAEEMRRELELWRMKLDAFLDAAKKANERLFVPDLLKGNGESNLGGCQINAGNGPEAPTYEF